MWFKNARLYRLTSPITVNLNEALAQFPFVPCGDHDHQRYGFVPPLQGSELLVHAGDHCGMICAKREEKILPGAAVKNAVEAKVLDIMEKESRPVARSERAAIKDAIILSMLPKAFTRSRLEYAYIDLKLGFIIVDASSAPKAEDLLSKLREALGSLRCIPVSMSEAPSRKMTLWVDTQFEPNRFKIGSDIDLQSAKDGRIVKCRNVDWTASEIKNHIQSNMTVSRLQMVWADAITFNVDDTFGIKGLKFADVVLDKSNDGNPETKAEQFDNDFRVMSLELRNMITDLIEAFGGEDKSLIDNPVS